MFIVQHVLLFYLVVSTRCGSNACQNNGACSESGSQHLCNCISSYTVTSCDTGKYFSIFSFDLSNFHRSFHVKIISQNKSVTYYKCHLSLMQIFFFKCSKTVLQTEKEKYMLISSS